MATVAPATASPAPVQGPYAREIGPDAASDAAPARGRAWPRYCRRSSRDAPAATVVASTHPARISTAATHCAPPSGRQ